MNHPKSQTARDSALRPESSNPIQQLTGQVSSHDNQYQCGHPLFQLGMVAARPITSPSRKNQRTCLAAVGGAKRAHIHAQNIEMATKHAVLAMSAWSEGMRPRTTSL